MEEQVPAELQSRLANRQADMQAEEAMSASVNTEQGLAPVSGDQVIKEHLNSLAPQEQEFLAAFMTPEFAQAVGLLTGSEELFQFVSSRADSSRTLLPVPAAEAKEFLASMQDPTAEATLQESEMVQEQQPAPSGAMAPVMVG